MESSTLYANALCMWRDYGVYPPINTPTPVSELRLVSGLPFNLYVIEGKPGPREGMAFAAMAGWLEELQQMPDGPLVRMHSACMFSEVGDDPELETWLQAGVTNGHQHDRINRRSPNPKSDECDCREQRQVAQALIAAAGGIYIDLAEQEGRGWGLEIKREIYRLYREEGLDTVEACERLGIEPDVRSYVHVARFLLHDLGLTRLRLLSNNPRKIRALEAIGIIVTPLAHIVGVKPKSVGYQRTKRDKLGHQFPGDDELNGLLGA